MRNALLFLFLISIPLKGQNRISVNIPSAKEEADHIWRNLQDLNFFEEHGYTLSLPQGEVVDNLKQKTKEGNLTNSDYQSLLRFVTDSVYQREDYLKGYHHIEKEMKSINQMIDELHQLNLNWGFKTFENYTVNLTLYGPGGSYDAEEGSLLLFTTPKGAFKSYKNPANTIIHEIVHMAIEESIIAKYHVPHALKERIVDSFVFLHFKQYLPEYRIQDMGEYRTDTYLKETKDFKDLNKIVEQVLR